MCVHHICAVPEEVRRGYWIHLELKLQVVVRHYMGARNFKLWP